MQYLHWTIRNHSHQPFLKRSTCVWTWNYLQEYFPDALACILMPNHIHLLSPNSNPIEQKAAFSRLIQALSQKEFLGSKTWDPITIPEGATDDRQKILRQIRYIHLNPCRAKIIKNPVEWEWSTHLDYLGWVHRPWCTVEKLAPIGLRHNITSFHRYVITDDTVTDRYPLVSVSETISEKEQNRYPIEWIKRASAIANRCSMKKLKIRSQERINFVRLAWDLGWKQPSLLAEITSSHTRSILNYRSSSSFKSIPERSLLANPRLILSFRKEETQVPLAYE